MPSIRRLDTKRLTLSPSGLAGCLAGCLGLRPVRRVASLRYRFYRTTRLVFFFLLLRPLQLTVSEHYGSLTHGPRKHGSRRYGPRWHGSRKHVQHERKPEPPSRHKEVERLMVETMQMLFTWDTNNLCIVFKSWRVTSTMSLLWSLLGVMLLTAGYELVREISRRYEARVQKEIDDMPSKFHPLVLCPFSIKVIYGHTFAFVCAKTFETRSLNWLFFTKTIKKEAHCSHQDALLPTRMQRPRLLRLRCTPFKYFIHFSSCKFLPLCSASAGLFSRRAFLYFVFRGR